MNLEKRMRKMTIEEHYMKEAIRQAKKAAALKEVPIGCVIVYDGRIIARGYNRRTVDKNVLAHAEIIAMRKACRILGDWRLEDCTMYVTLEPCPMCAGAIVQARIPKVVIGCMNPKAGCAEITPDRFRISQTNLKFFFHPDYTVGPGISPDHASRLAGFTAGRELHPALKNNY